MARAVTADEPLEQAAELVCRTLDGSPDGFAIVDTDGVVIDANRTLASWTRAAASDRLRGASLLGSGELDLREALRRGAAGDTVVVDTEHPPFAPPRFGSYRLHFGPFRIGEQVRAISVLFEDRTEQALAAEAFEASERRFRLLVDCANDGIGVHRNGILLYMNPAGIRMLGYESAEELIGRRILDLTAEDSRGVARERLSDAGRSAPREELLVRKDGTSIVVEVSTSRGPLGDGLANFVFFRDITAFKKLQAELSAAHSAAAGTPEPPSAIPARHRPLVLVCDDERRLAMLTAGLLVQHGFVADTASSVEEALRAVDRHGPAIAVVLLDVNFPGHDAREVLQRLKKHGLGAPIILMSGYAPEDVPAELVSDSQVAGYLAKPYAMEHLVSQIHAALVTAGPPAASAAVQSVGSR